MIAARLHAFPASHRIARRAEFVELGHRGRRQDTRYLRALYAPAADPCAHARVGITVTKRIGNAVVRNRIKRHVREAFRTASWPAGIDLVFIATAAAATASGHELAACVHNLATRLAKLPPNMPKRP